MRLHVEGIGLAGPGLPDWAAGAPVLAGRAAYEPAPVVLAPSALLPPAERRRMTETVKLALAVGSEAVAGAGREAGDLPSVFASSGGDGATITAILDILASEQREVSPTRFHNSVHNAPSGYWSIATHSRESSTSLCAHDFSFAAGLLEAAALAVAEARPVLLAAYDVPYPAVLHAVRPIHSTFGTALVLSPERSVASLATLTLSLERGDGAETRMAAPALEDLRTGNPAARALPLLAALAEGAARDVALPLMAGNLLKLAVVPMAPS
ncbi:MAG TPA: beta-ketoacyl synthase chain length factor [Aliidongia sp.]|nr:beta-ketoacyl synthase chain length factor [Aliidongia sp.]